MEKKLSKEEQDFEELVEAMKRDYPEIPVERIREMLLAMGA